MWTGENNAKTLVWTKIFCTKGDFCERIMYVYVTDHSPRGFSGSMNNTLWGDFARLLYGENGSRAVYDLN